MKGDYLGLLRHDTFSSSSIETANTQSARCEAPQSVTPNAWALECQRQKMRVRRETAPELPQKGRKVTAELQHMPSATTNRLQESNA